jgi:predicted transcriptional regulator
MVNIQNEFLKKKIYNCLTKIPQPVSEIMKIVNKGYPTVRVYLERLVNEKDVKVKTVSGARMYYK